MSAEPLVPEARDGFPFWVISTACSRPLACELGRQSHESSRKEEKRLYDELDHFKERTAGTLSKLGIFGDALAPIPAVVSNVHYWFSYRSIGLDREAAAESYREAFRLGASLGYPYQLHGICFITERYLKARGIDLGFYLDYSGKAELPPHDEHIHRSLETAADAKPYPPVEIFKFGRHGPRIRPSVNYSDELLLDDPWSFVNRSNSFENELLQALDHQALSHDYVGIISSKIRDCTALSDHMLQKLIQKVFNGT